MSLFPAHHFLFSREYNELVSYPFNAFQSTSLSYYCAWNECSIVSHQSGFHSSVPEHSTRFNHALVGSVQTMVHSRSSCITPVIIHALSPACHTWRHHTSNSSIILQSSRYNSKDISRMYPSDQRSPETSLIS